MGINSRVHHRYLGRGKGRHGRDHRGRHDHCGGLLTLSPHRHQASCSRLSGGLPSRLTAAQAAKDKLILFFLLVPKPRIADRIWPGLALPLGCSRVTCNPVTCMAALAIGRHSPRPGECGGSVPYSVVLCIDEAWNKDGSGALCMTIDKDLEITKSTG